MFRSGLEPILGPLKRIFLVGGTGRRASSIVSLKATGGPCDDAVERLRVDAPELAPLEGLHGGGTRLAEQKRPLAHVVTDT